MAGPSFYITTAIDYPNGTPHMGHAYEKTVSDFYARFYRAEGRQVFFLTGTDENGQKLSQSAAAQNIPTQQFVDQNVEIFKTLCAKLELTHDDFIRTTESRHHDMVKWFWQELEKKEFIYQGEYSGHYCIDCESFYPESQLLEDNHCPAHHKPLPIKKEAGAFFKLSAFKDKIIQHIEDHPEFIVPASSRKEILSRLRSDEMRDLSITRKNEGWGITVPGQDNFVVYTWFDALINYYTALKFPEEKRLQEFWPASVHVIGKDIAWFHTVIWPSMLMAMGISLPQQVYVHGMVLAEDGKKMSKSLGNGVDPMELLEKYDHESVKFYMLFAIPGHGDGRFSEKELIDTHNNVLANDLGNMIMRVIKLILKKMDGHLIRPENFSSAPCAFIGLEKLHNDVLGLVKNFEHHKAIARIWTEVNAVNIYINEQAPWKHKELNNELLEIIYQCVYAMDIISQELVAFLPRKAEAIQRFLGRIEKDPSLTFGAQSYQLIEPTVLFQKIV